ncbi:hypothetical protein QFZ81_006432 [Paenibacillus sp. V4I9]|uniref:SRPBCC domain-containing protein n=1 Tax=Paenibacillus sp. V4I9 TaxID=3042308 RepID=UPI002787F70C|nr:SRPBCC domain-containing protein [Paenibacillus sp. V4I9]MDQ0891344.1 hypothetical protein [Paenibacillus sp. V4I9]
MEGSDGGGAVVTMVFTRFTMEIPLLQVGEPVFFHHSPNTYHAGTEVVTLRATIESIESLERFAVRWDAESSDIPTITTFTLTEEKGGTIVTLTESGYETKQQVEQVEEGYGMSLENLKAHLDGESLPY